MGTRNNTFVQNELLSAKRGARTRSAESRRPAGTRRQSGQSRSLANFPAGSRRRARSRASGSRGNRCARTAPDSRCSLPQCGRGANGERRLDVAHQGVDLVRVLAPREADAHAVAPVRGAQPQVVGRDRADLADVQVRRDASPSARTARSAPRRARGRRSTRSASRRRQRRRRVEPEVRQPQHPWPDDARLGLSPMPSGHRRRRTSAPRAATAAPAPGVRRRPASSPRPSRRGLQGRPSGSRCRRPP